VKILLNPKIHNAGWYSTMLIGKSSLMQTGVTWRRWMKRGMRVTAIGRASGAMKEGTNGEEISAASQAAENGSTGLELLTAKKAAKLLRVDTKTLRRMGVHYIPGGGSKRYYTVALLRTWQAERMVRCQQQTDSADGSTGRSRGRNISRKGTVRRTGTSTSRSTVIDFEKALGLRPRKTPPPSPPNGGTSSGAR
jgi:hypothetical protein